MGFEKFCKPVRVGRDTSLAAKIDAKGAAVISSSLVGILGFEGQPRYNLFVDRETRRVGIAPSAEGEYSAALNRKRLKAGDWRVSSARLAAFGVLVRECGWSVPAGTVLVPRCDQEGFGCVFALPGAPEPAVANEPQKGAESPRAGEACSGSAEAIEPQNGVQEPPERGGSETGGEVVSPSLRENRRCGMRSIETTAEMTLRLHESKISVAEIAARLNLSRRFRDDGSRWSAAKVREFLVENGQALAKKNPRPAPATVAAAESAAPKEQVPAKPKTTKAQPLTSSEIEDVFREVVQYPRKPFDVVAADLGYPVELVAPVIKEWLPQLQRVNQLSGFERQGALTELCSIMREKRG